ISPTAPIIIERHSTVAYTRPCCAKARIRVARATDGAPPKIPANAFGTRSTPSAGKRETSIPPRANRTTSSPMAGRHDGPRRTYFPTASLMMTRAASTTTLKCPSASEHGGFDAVRHSATIAPPRRRVTPLTPLAGGPANGEERASDHLLERLQRPDAHDVTSGLGLEDHRFLGERVDP